jgi:malate dehydrogenase (oxaloacetate-decarboxylating)
MDPLPTWQERYHARFIITLRVRMPDETGSLARLLDALGAAGAMLGDIRIVGADSTHKVRDVQIYAVDQAVLDRAIAAVRALPRYDLQNITDDVLEIHRHGTIETRARVPLETTSDLRMVYTPGVASVCELIAAKPEQAWKYTALGHRIAIVTNGTAVLGLGDIGPLASLPVMEGKAAILARFVGVSADPILVDTRAADEVVEVVARIATGYGAIQLEDIAAPECFEIEQRLQARLDKPVFHDDQHGTATVVLAGLMRALQATGRRADDCRGVILGAGAAGLAISLMLADYGIRDLVVCDSIGAIHVDRREGMNEWKRHVAARTNPRREHGSVGAAMRGKDLFIGVSRPGMVTRAMVASMAKDPIVFALANPVSEITAEDALAAGAAIALDGRSMNNALAYPGIFRGALDARAARITPGMKVAAAEAIASSSADALLPDMFDPQLHGRVARAVAAAWVREAAPPPGRPSKPPLVRSR